MKDKKPKEPKEKTSEEVAKSLPKQLPQNPMLASLPVWVKNPNNFTKIQKALYEAGVSSCDHAELIEWHNCVKCQMKQHERAEMLRKFGFKEPGQYITWKKTMETIIRLKQKNTWIA